MTLKNRGIVFYTNERQNNIQNPTAEAAKATKVKNPLSFKEKFSQNVEVDKVAKNAAVEFALYLGTSCVAGATNALIQNSKKGPIGSKVFFAGFVPIVAAAASVPASIGIRNQLKIEQTIHPKYPNHQDPYSPAEAMVASEAYQKSKNIFTKLEDAKGILKQFKAASILPLLMSIGVGLGGGCREFLAQLNQKSLENNGQLSPSDLEKMITKSGSQLPAGFLQKLAALFKYNGQPALAAVCSRGVQPLIEATTQFRNAVNPLANVKVQPGKDILKSENMP